MSFKVRTTKPGKGNKYYIRKANGGYSNAIKGSPTDSECNVLSNCVGYAYGRFNEIGGYGCCKYLAPVNAENFMQYKGSCKTGSTPKVGSVMVWQGNGSLAGHVAIVEKVNSSTQVFTSESSYGGKAFFNSTRNKGSNGNWGLSTTNYKFLGFIYNPAVKEETTKPATTTNTKKGTLTVNNGSWNVRKGAGTNYAVVKVVKGGTKLNYYGTSNGWYKVDGGYISPKAVKVNSASTVTYLSNKSYKGSSIVEGLNQIKVNSTYSYRSKLAAKNGIKNYTGTPAQNTKMLNLLKQGKLIKA